MKVSRVSYQKSVLQPLPRCSPHFLRTYPNRHRHFPCFGDACFPDLQPHHTPYSYCNRVGGDRVHHFRHLRPNRPLLGEVDRQELMRFETQGPRSCKPSLSTEGDHLKMPQGRRHEMGVWWGFNGLRSDPERWVWLGVSFLCAM